MPDLPDNLKGTHVFHYLNRPEDEWLAEPERDELALALRKRIEALE